jgi:Fe2+ or Zn2+ uptake regulation protein
MTIFQRSADAFDLPNATAPHSRRIAERAVVLRAVGQSAANPYIDEIHRRVSLSDPRIGLSKVHALLNSFVEEGLVLRRQFGRSRPRYVLVGALPG